MKLFATITGLVLCFALIVLTGDSIQLELNESTTTNSVVGWTNPSPVTVYISFMSFTYESSGTYTATVQSADSFVTNKVLSETITADTDGTWLPESKVWLDPGDRLIITVPGGATNNTIKIKGQLAK